ncbi:MAG: serine protein kinase RIO [Euryarchaeota archaeon]|nr:serine protein kinase RIO [Euryarchaeota archaeon]
MSSEGFLNDKWLKKLDHQTRVLYDHIGLDRKTMDEVFDKRTLLDLGRLMSNHVIDIVDFPISTGKEANVFRAVTPEKTFVALKIYRTSNMTFKHIWKYIEGDPRFKSANKNRQQIVYEWARKEYKNLERLHQARVRAPHPLKRLNHILIMDYIGSAGQPAPMLKDTELKNPKKVYATLLTYISKMYSKAKLIHADLSAYNVLMYEEKPYIIDLAQGVLLGHPQAPEFLRRDIHNIVSFFERFDIHGDEKQIYENIVRKT